MPGLFETTSEKDTSQKKMSVATVCHTAFMPRWKTDAQRESQSSDGWIITRQIGLTAQSSRAKILSQLNSKDAEPEE